MLESEADDHRSGQEHRRETDSFFVFFIVLAFVATMVSASLLLPFFRVPDEAFHVDLVRLAGQPSVWVRDGWPVVGERHLPPEITAARQVWRTKTGGRTLDSAPPPPERRPTFDEMGAGRSEGPHNRMTQHPPLHYLATSIGAAPLKALWPGEVSFDQEIWIYRLVNVAMIAPLMVIVLGVAKSLNASAHGSAAALVFLLAIPGLTMRNAAMVNNDNLVTLLSSGVVLLAVRIALGETSIRYAILIGAGVGLTALTKGFGLLLPFTVVVAYLESARRNDVSRPFRWLLGRLSIAGVAALSAGMWWWIRNLIMLGELQPSGIEVPSTPGVSWTVWVEKLLTVPWMSFWGGSFVLSREDQILMFALVAVMMIGIFVSLAKRNRHDRPALLVALSPLIVLVSWLYILRITEGRVTGLHGRYFYGAAVAIVTAMGVGWAGITRRFSNWLPTVALLGAAITNAIAFYRLTTRYWGQPGDTLPERWIAIQAWLPVEPSTLVIAFMMMMLGYAGALWCSLRSYAGVRASAA